MFVKKYLLLLIVVFMVLSSSVSIAKDKDDVPVINWYDDFIFTDSSFTFEFIRTIGYSTCGGADIGECVATALKVSEGDDVSWYNEWKKTGDRLSDYAAECEEKGHVISSREAYFRASNYYRTAEFFMHSKENLETAIKTWKKSKEAFLSAISGHPYFEVIEIPYEDTYLPGYFMKTSLPVDEPPLLIVQTGFDGTGEELYFSTGLDAVKRGYNCLIFEGPGQGGVIREQNLHFRYDWEKVVTPVVDYALSRDDVFEGKIALLGISMGGYLAPRAVAFEHRIDVCIANGGVYDFYEGLASSLPEVLIDLIDKDPESFNEAIYGLMKKMTSLRWFFNHGMWTFGVETPVDFMKQLEKYTLKDILKDINCHMLIIKSEGDTFWNDQPELVYKELECSKDFILFTREETAQAHCQEGAIKISNEMIFNWLDEFFRD